MTNGMYGISGKSEKVDADLKVVIDNGLADNTSEAFRRALALVADVMRGESEIEPLQRTIEALVDARLDVLKKRDTKAELAHFLSWVSNMTPEKRAAMTFSDVKNWLVSTSLYAPSRATIYNWLNSLKEKS